MAQNSGVFNLATVNQAVGTGTWPNSRATTIQLLVVGGGGGGSAGGGGGGGFQQGDSVPVTPGTSYSINVGAGGASNSGPGVAGGASTFGSLFYSNGGGGGQWRGQGSTAQGGSGGGGPADTSNSFPGGSYPGQGNPGGGDLSGYSAAPGGGGAGSAGVPVFRQFSQTAYNGQGGIGIHSLISGSLVSYANGAAGAYSATNLSGAAGTGNGATGTSANGGSGTVIVSYPDTLAAATTTGTVTASTSGSGNVAFSGTGQYLSSPSNSGFSFGTGDFTVEAWIYTNLLTGERGFFQTSATAGGLQTTYVDGIIINIGNTAGVLSLNIANVGVNSGSTYIAVNTWYHVAVTRASGSVRLFINGVLVGGPTTITANITGTYAVVGGYYSNAYLWNGNISNLRVVKGTAVYTSNFTPSTTPLTAISGTSLLMNTVSGAQFADSSTNVLALTATGSPTWNTLSPFTVAGYKNRVYTFTGTGTITF